jgi:hypothetical protein
VWRGFLVRPSLTFPAPPLKFRTLSSPQSGFKPWRLSINPTLPERSTEVKHQVCLPPLPSQFDSAFVASWPSCRHGWGSQTTQPRAGVATPTAHGSLAPGGFCGPTPLRSCDPSRQSRRLPPLSQMHWLYGGSLPDDLVWAGGETFPALGHHSFFACRHPYAERRDKAPQAPLVPLGLPPQNTESAPPLPLTPAAVRALLTTLQCSLYATARKVAGPPGLVRPRVELRPPRTFTPELARGRSPAPRVGYHYTALLGENCDRTSTGWNGAVTGCAFCRKVYGLHYILKRSRTKNTTNCG